MVDSAFGISLFRHECTATFTRPPSQDRTRQSQHPSPMAMRTPCLKNTIDVNLVNPRTSRSAVGLFSPTPAPYGRRRHRTHEVQLWQRVRVLLLVFLSSYLWLTRRPTEAVPWAPINMNINNGVRFEKHDLASALSHKIKSARGCLSHKPSSNHILPRRDGQGSNEGSKLTAQPHVGGGVGGRAVGGTFRVLETQERERSVRRLDGQFELTTSVRDASANFSSPSYYPLPPAC